MRSSIKKRPSKAQSPLRIQRAAAAAPVALSYRGALSLPATSSKRDGSIRVRRTEFVGSISNGAVTGYSLLGLSALTPGYDINPGCVAFFPWLSGMAENYERFMMHDLSVRIIPSQATSTAGRLYAALDYDYDDPPPSSKFQMMSNQTHVEGSVWEQLVVKAVPKELHADGRAKYISHATRGNFVEPRTAYCGYFLFAVDTPTANLNFDLEVSYDVELFLPIVDAPLVIDSSPDRTTIPEEVVTSNLVNYSPLKAGYVGHLLVQFLRGVPPNSPVKVVTPGIGGCPPMNFYGNATCPCPATACALDLSGIPGKRGVLTLANRIWASGLTPDTIYTTKGLFTESNLFDSNGAYLGAVRADTSVAPGNTSAVDCGITHAVADSRIYTTWTQSIKELFAAFPAARYFVPFYMLTAANAIAGAGGSGTRLSVAEA